jgi:hypothetical protein
MSAALVVASETFPACMAMAIACGIDLRNGIHGAVVARIALCEEALRRFGSDDELLVENRQRALAESYYELGEAEKAEALYRDWLQADPRCGVGSAGRTATGSRAPSRISSDANRFCRRDYPSRRLGIGQIWPNGSPICARNRGVWRQLLFPVSDNYFSLSAGKSNCRRTQGRDEEAREFRRQAQWDAATVRVSQKISSVGKVFRKRSQINFGGAGLPLSELSNVASLLHGSPAPAPVTRQKIGRNEPCPCGSGKKYKKCCGGGSAII